MYNITFYNNSVISWQSDILVEEVPRQNHQTATSFWQIFIMKCSIEYTFTCACMFRKWTLDLNSERHLIAYLDVNSTTIVRTPLAKGFVSFYHHLSIIYISLLKPLEQLEPNFILEKLMECLLQNPLCLLWLNKRHKNCDY